MALEDKVENLDRKMDTIIQLLQGLKESFPTKKSVANYFGVTDRTIDYWIKNGKFEEGVEYTIDNDGRIKYITNGIINHQEKSKNKEKKNIQEKEYLNPSATNILRSLSCLK
jgi:hypothetical protein